MISTHPSAIDAGRAVVRTGLELAVERAGSLGLPVTRIEGKLLRPLLAYAAVPSRMRSDLPEGFWMGALAIQMVHEASLLHDDILDGAPIRRGRTPEAARGGTSRALVLGDHLLTGAYRVALEAGSPDLLAAFVEAVERTVAGEAAQGRSAGARLDTDTYLEILEAKSGALFGCAMALPSLVAGQGDSSGLECVGRRVGRLYQILDDVLDYCPGSDRGKLPFQDYIQEKWTLPLEALGTIGFGLPTLEVHRRLFTPGPDGLPPMRRVMEEIRHEIRMVREEHRLRVPDDRILPSLLARWEARLERDLAREERAVAAFQELSARAKRLETPRGRSQVLERHARTFDFAGRLLPSAIRDEIADVYAFCRFTDDLVDEVEGRPRGDRRLLLRAWGVLSRQAWEGVDTGVRLLDDVLRRAARRGVPFEVVEGLLEGMAWDLEPRSYATLAELEEYADRVAGTVGEWFAHILGCGDAAILERARTLGRAMQLTNLLRDVGQDLRMGRLYLPLDRMAAHGIHPRDLEEAAHGRKGLPPGYPALVEELLGEADARYEAAMEGIPALPDGVRKAVAVAARAYRGIHDEIRRNRYDSLTRRAATSLFRKLVLAGVGLSDLRSLERRNRCRGRRVPALETPCLLLSGPSGTPVSS